MHKRSPVPDQSRAAAAEATGDHATAGNGCTAPSNGAMATAWLSVAGRIHGGQSQDGQQRRGLRRLLRGIGLGDQLADGVQHRLDYGVIKSSGKLDDDRATDRCALGFQGALAGPREGILVPPMN